MSLTRKSPSRGTENSTFLETRALWLVIDALWCCIPARTSLQHVLAALGLPSRVPRSDDIAYPIHKRPSITCAEMCVCVGVCTSISVSIIHHYAALISIHARAHNIYAASFIMKLHRSLIPSGERARTRDLRARAFSLPPTLSPLLSRSLHTYAHALTGQAWFCYQAQRTRLLSFSRELHGFPVQLFLPRFRSLHQQAREQD